MADWLRQATTQTIKLGPFVSAADGATPQTALSLAPKLSKAGGALAARHDTATITHDADGFYSVELDATDTATAGRLKVEVPGTSSTFLPAWLDCLVIPQGVYDALVAGTATLAANATAINAVSTAAVLAVGAYLGNATAAIAVDANGRVKVQGPLPRNTALAGFTFDMVLSSDGKTPATGKTVTATRSLDGAAFAACTNAPVEIGGGTYKLDLSAADLNGSTVQFKFAEATCLTTIIEVVTTP